ncbi:aminodeoxychorismate lyase [Arenimonas sp.]|uniref:aminodeoxychorismate lyase n=1 Tax=Arenimonas sp. TaxID=1872635 RepID=UPI0039E22571
MSVRILRDGTAADGLAADDRGLAYGDGLFETLLVHEGRALWWDAHWRRLQKGAERLRIPVPKEEHLVDEVSRLVYATSRAVLKLVLTRGAGGRGYAPPARVAPTIVLSLHEAPDATPAAGLDLRWCDVRLATQPALAGIKHLNRLEQVLARLEWNDPAIDEGLMLDERDRVISATAGNVFALIGGRWLTPRVSECGVAGVMREWLLAHVDGASEAELDRDAIETAEAVFVCNSVRGPQPVRRIDRREWGDFAAIRTLAHRLLAREPAFAFSFAPWLGDNRTET